MSKKALVAVADGIEEIETVCIIDVLRRAGVEVVVASAANQNITASRGTKIVADTTIAACKTQIFDLIVLPGGMPGAEHLRDCSELVSMLKEQKNSGRFYAAICASPAVVFAAHKLLTGRKATCYPAMQSRLENCIPNQNVVVDGNCITSQGPGTAIEFALKLAELLVGKNKAQEVARAMLADTAH